MLEARNVYKSFPHQENQGDIVEAVRGVSFTLNQGGFYALVGESGSGKTTLSHLLMGLIPPTSGDILLDGRSIISQGKRREKELCTRLQLVLQDGKSALDPRQTIYKCIAEPIRNLCSLSKQEEKERIHFLMKQMDLPLEYLCRKPTALSGGEQKRVCIARALAPRPDIIIFDEAVSGLDVLTRKDILDLLKQLHKKQGATYLIITHDMDVALYLADHIMVMKDGEIVEKADDFRNDISRFVHPYSKLLLSAMLTQTNINNSRGGT